MRGGKRRSFLRGVRDLRRHQARNPVAMGMSLGKRSFDVVFSAIGLIVLSPLLALIALVVYLEDRHGPIFRQERVGERGRSFVIWKFRSMRPEVCGVAARISVGRDSRVTRVGRLLRASKLDELPQLLNVLRGDMSFVGPRPELRRYVELYSGDELAVLKLRPGITDPASIRYRNEADVLQGFADPEQAYVQVLMRDKIRINLRYAAIATRLSDLWVILGTIGLAMTKVEEIMNCGDSLRSTEAHSQEVHVSSTPATDLGRRFGRNRHILALDCLLLSISTFLVYALRFEGLNWSPADWHTAVVFTAVSVPLRLLIYWSFGLYQRLWRYASIAELERILLAGIVGSVAAFIVGFALLPSIGLVSIRVPVSVLFTNGLLSIAIIAAPRLVARVGGWRAAERMLRSVDRQRALIAGAGAGGRMIVRELIENPKLGLTPIGFLDDDAAKHGQRLGGLPVFGSLGQLGQVAEREEIHELIIAMPSARGTVLRDLARSALDAGIKTRTMPSLGDILSGRVRVNALREIEIHDLLRRDPIQTDLEQVRKLAENRTVLVTGAGGSIGSELARQIAELSPRTLVILDHAENPVFHIQNELRAAHPELRIVPVIADVRDRRRMMSVLERHSPYSVFHAAAHKHVPLMEENPVEAVTNNVKGTQNLVDAAVAADVEHFVFISTDKAVRPTSVMGATKRVAEHVVRHAALKHGKNYVAVRFGNVLGSEGSVVPTFLAQIRKGGPVTVTHPEMRRFFMTIPEAVQLVLQAGALGRGGELFMLDMGEMVKIVDLARDLIRLSGLEVGTDIEIRFTGMRPGEKLYEEMFFEHERAVPTDHPKVLRGHNEFPNHDSQLINDLVAAAMQGVEDAEIRRLLCEIVPDFTTELAVASAPAHVSPVDDLTRRRLGQPISGRS